MRITTTTAGKLGKTPLLVLCVAEGSKPSVPAGVKLPPGFTKNFDGKARSTSSTFATSGPAERVLLIGTGTELCDEGLRRVAAIAAQQAESLGAAKAVLVAPKGSKSLPGDRIGRALAEGAAMGAYRFDSQKSEPTKPKCSGVAIATDDAATKRGVKDGVSLAEANAFTRDLQNLPGNKMTPRDFAKYARQLAAGNSRITCKVMDEKQMAAMGMGLLLGVSQGSTEPARLLHLTYKPKGKAKGRVALVGKGLTFDAGGYSLKPPAKMDEMRYDMSGGAAVLGCFKALRDLDVPVEVHGIVGCSENLIDGNATKPGDVHTGMAGKTVEVLNTDAEGRLVLADCLTYTCRKVKPDTILDLATLTGAVIVALGHEVSGIFPSNDTLRDALIAAGERTGEACWPLPLLDVHKDAMKGKHADLQNIGSPAVGAGSSQGAAFLSHFVEGDVDWCHLDIAGTAWNTTNRDWVGGAAGSGVGARLLFEYLANR